MHSKMFVRITIRIMYGPFRVESGIILDIGAFHKDVLWCSCCEILVVVDLDTVNPDSYWEFVRDPIVTVCFTIFVRVP